MALLIKDDHLEKQIKQEQERRGHGSMARTATALLIERLTQLHSTRTYEGHPVVRTGPGGEYIQDWPAKEDQRD